MKDTSNRQRSIEASIVGASFVIILGMGASQVLSYLFQVVVARLGPETFGVFSMCLATVVIASQLSGLGLPAGVIRYVPFYYGRGDEARLRGVLLFALGVSGGMAFVFGAGLYAGAPWISGALSENPALSWGLKIVAVALPLLAFKQILIKAFVALHSYQYRIVFFQVMENSLKVALVFLLLALGWGLAGTLTAYVLALLVSVASAFLFLDRRIFGVLRNAVSPVLETKELFVFSLPLYFSGLLTLGGNWLDVLVLGFLRSAPEVGIYSVGLLFATILLIAPELFLPVSFPHVINMYARDETNAARDLARQVSTWLTVVLIFAALWIVLVGRDVLLLFFGKSYEGGWLVVQLLLVGNLFASMSQPSFRILSMVKQTRLIFMINLVAMVCTVVGYVVLIPRYGLYGAAATSSISLTVRSLLLEVGAARAFRFSAFGLRQGPFGKIAATGVAAASIAYFVGRAFDGLSAFLAITGTLVAVYLLGLVALRVITLREWKLVRELFPSPVAATVEEVSS